MQNTVDTRSQQIQQQRLDTKVKKQTADSEKEVKTPTLNRPATAQYLNIVSHEQDEVGDVLARSYNRLNQSLTQTAAAPEQQPIDEQAEKMGTYAKLAVKVISRDPNLQEQVAQDLSSGKKLVRSRNAADTLHEALSNLPRPLKEGTTTGKHLAKFIVENLVTLTDTKNMGAGLERDLAVRQISVPKQQPNLRTQQATSKVLAASIAYVQSNQPEVLATLESDTPEAVKPGTTTAQVMTRYLRQALNEFPEDSTYLDIFKQNRGHQKAEGYADKMSEEIAQRIHNLISKAANTAKSGNLIQLSPEEAARFDQIQREAAGQGLNQATQGAQGQANANLANANASNTNNAGNSANTLTNANAAKGNASNAGAASANAAESSSESANPQSAQGDKSMRTLSLSELSARAAKLQQQFRQERQRLANDGKLPDPAPLPAKSFDNVKTARDILKGTLSPENFALTERQQQVKEQLNQQQNNLNTSLLTSKLNAEAPSAQEQSANAANKLVQTLSSGNQSASAQGQALVQGDTNTTNAANASKAANAANESNGANGANDPKSQLKNLLNAQLSAPEKPQAAMPSVASGTQSLTRQPSFDQGTIKAPAASFQMEFNAIQNNVYGDIDIMPGMTIPVSHFGELSQDKLQPNKQALESLKVQARLLEESLKQQAQNVLNQDGTEGDGESNLKATSPNMSELEQALKASQNTNTNTGSSANAKANANAGTATANTFTSAQTKTNAATESAQKPPFNQANSQANAQTHASPSDTQGKGSNSSETMATPLKLQQFLQQAANAIQQQASSSGEPLSLEQTQLQQFLKQAQEVLQKLAPNLGEDITSSITGKSGTAAANANSNSANNSANAYAPANANSNANAEAKAPSGTLMGNNAPSNAQAQAQTQPQSQAQTQGQAQTSAQSQGQSSASTEAQAKPASTANASNKADNVISGGTKAKASANTNASAHAKANSEVSIKPETLSALKAALEESNASLQQQIKAQGGLVFPNQERLQAALTSSLEALQSKSAPENLPAQLKDLQNALDQQVKSQGNMQTPSQSQLQKVLTQAQSELESAPNRASTSAANSSATSAASENIPAILDKAQAAGANTQTNAGANANANASNSNTQGSATNTGVGTPSSTVLENSRTNWALAPANATNELSHKAQLQEALNKTLDNLQKQVQSQGGQIFNAQNLLQDELSSTLATLNRTKVTSEQLQAQLTSLQNALSKQPQVQGRLQNPVQAELQTITSQAQQELSARQNLQEAAIQAQTQAQAQPQAQGQSQTAQASQGTQGAQTQAQSTPATVSNGAKAEAETKANANSAANNPTNAKANAGTNAGDTASTDTAAKSSSVGATQEGAKGTATAEAAASKPQGMSKELSSALKDALNQTLNNLKQQQKTQDGQLFPTQSALHKEAWGTLAILPQASSDPKRLATQLANLQNALDAQTQAQGKIQTPVQSKLQEVISQAQQELTKAAAADEAEAQAKANAQAQSQAQSALKEALNQSLGNLQQQIKAQGGLVFPNQSALQDAAQKALNTLGQEGADPKALSAQLQSLQEALTKQTQAQGNLQTPSQSQLQKALTQFQQNLTKAQDQGAGTPNANATGNVQGANAQPGQAQGQVSGQAQAQTAGTHTAGGVEHNAQNPLSKVLPSADNLKQALEQALTNLQQQVKVQGDQIFPTQTALQQESQGTLALLQQLQGAAQPASQGSTLISQLASLQEALAQQIQAQGNIQTPSQAQLQQVLTQAQKEIASLPTPPQGAQATTGQTAPATPGSASTSSASGSLNQAQTPIAGTANQTGTTNQPGTANAAGTTGILSTAGTTGTPNAPASGQSGATLPAVGSVIDTQRLQQALEQTQQNIVQQVKAQGGQAAPQQLQLLESLESVKTGLNQSVALPELNTLLNQAQGTLLEQTKLQGNLQTPAQAHLQQVLNQDLTALRQAYAQAQAQTPGQAQGTTLPGQGAAQVPTSGQGAVSGQSAVPGQGIASGAAGTTVATGTTTSLPQAPNAAQVPGQTNGPTAKVTPNTTTAAHSAEDLGTLGLLNSIKADPSIGRLIEFNNSLAQAQNALKVLQEAPTLPQKQAAFDQIQQSLTLAHTRITSPEVNTLPNLPQMQQLVGFSELSVINIARANTPELTAQAMQQLNLCLNQAQREAQGQLAAKGVLAQLQQMHQGTTTGAAQAGTTQPGTTPGSVAGQPQAQTPGSSPASSQSQLQPQAQQVPTQTSAQSQALTQSQVLTQGQVPGSSMAQANTQSAPQTITQNTAQSAAQSDPQNAATATNSAVAQPSPITDVDSGLPTEEAELAAKFNQFKNQGTVGNEVNAPKVANAHITGSANLGTVLRTDYSNPQQAAAAAVAQGATLAHQATAGLTPQQAVSQGLSNQGMAWLASAAQNIGMNPEQFTQSLAQAQANAEQLRTQTPTLPNGDKANNSGVLNYRYTDIFYKMHSPGTTTSNAQVVANAQVLADGSAQTPNASGLNQSIVDFGKAEMETPEGVSRENSVFATRTSLGAAQERLEAAQAQRESVGSTERVQEQHAEVVATKENKLEQYQARQDVRAQQQQEVVQKQEQAEVALKQERAAQVVQQQQQQAAAQSSTKLGINADPDLVDQQFARLYQQQRADQQQYAQQQQANVAQQIRAGGGSITMPHSQVLAQGAVTGDLQQLTQNQALGAHGNTGASQATAEAQAQALAQGTQTIGRTAVMADDGLANNRPATVGNTNVEARNPITAGQSAITNAQGQGQASSLAQSMGSSLAQSSGMAQGTGMATSTGTPAAQTAMSGQSTMAGQAAMAGQTVNAGNFSTKLGTGGTVAAATGVNTAAGVGATSNVANAAAPGTPGAQGAQGTPGLVPTGDGRTALSVASLNNSMPFGATIPNSSTSLTIHLDDVNPIVQNMGSTVPSAEEALNTQALSGVAADTDFAPDEDFNALLQQNMGAEKGVAGAAAITSGKNEPIPEESVAPTVSAPREGGFLHRLASLFSGKTHDELGEEISAKTETEKNLSTTTPEQLKALHEQTLQSQLKQSSLDQLMQRLQTSVADQNLPPHVREQAHKLMQALENPVADLHSVSSWLNFVTGPMSPSSSQALAMHQWAFMLLCIRFEQIGKNVEKFLRKRMSGEEISELEPRIEAAHHESGIFNDLVDDAPKKAQSLLEDAMSQVNRLQQQMDGLPQGQLLPRYIPLPPFYRGGKEGSLHAQQQTDEDGGKSWHLNFNLDLEKLGPMQVKVKLRFPDIQMSFVTGNLEALQAVQAHMPELNARLKEIGLTSKGSSARLGRLSAPNLNKDNNRDHAPRNTYGDNAFNTKA